MTGKASTTPRRGKADWPCVDSANRFDSDLYSVCPVRCTGAHSIDRAHYLVLVPRCRWGWV